MKAGELIINSRKWGTFKVLYDFDDQNIIDQRRWFIWRNPSNNKFYVKANLWNKELKTNSGLLLHRVIMKAPKGLQVDHINGDPLDNRKENLRLCNHQQNQLNRGPGKNNISGYKGVHPRRPNHWAAQFSITIDGKRKWFCGEARNCKHASAHDYNKFIREYSDESFAYINKVKECNCDECLYLS